MDIRELQAAELAAAVDFRNSIFTPVDLDQWEAMDSTAVVARDGDAFAGVIPLQFRDFVVRPGVAVPVVFENAVGVAEGRRSQGIGSRMLDTAAEFIADRVDALFVYRGGWRSDGYRFYRKTGHGMLFHESIYTCRPTAAAPADIEASSWERVTAIEAEVLALHARCYAGCGGWRTRTPGFYDRVWRGHVYKNDDWRLFTWWRDGALAAYVLTNPHCLKWRGCALYDLAATDAAALHRVLDGVAAYAAAEGLPMNIGAGREHPLAVALRDYGFAEDLNTPYIMARILRPDRIFARLAAASPWLDRLELHVETPHRDAVLNAPANPAVTARLRLTETLFSRLMCCRLDLAAALAMGLVNLSPVPVEVEDALAAIFRPAPWAPPGIDYV